MSRWRKRSTPNKLRMAKAVSAFRDDHARWQRAGDLSADERADHRALMIERLSRSLLSLATLGTATRDDERSMATELYESNLALEDLALVFDPLEPGDVPAEPGPLIAILRAFGAQPHLSEEVHGLRARFRTLIRTEGCSVFTGSRDRAERFLVDGLTEDECGVAECPYCPKSGEADAG